MITDIEIISNLIDIMGHSPKELSVIQPLGCVCVPRTAARQAPLSSTISQNLLKLTSTESAMPSNHLILCRLLLLLPLIFPRVAYHIQEVYKRTILYTLKGMCILYLLSDIWQLLQYSFLNSGRRSQLLNSFAVWLSNTHIVCKEIFCISD